MKPAIEMIKLEPEEWYPPPMKGPIVYQGWAFDIRGRWVKRVQYVYPDYTVIETETSGGRIRSETIVYRR